MPNTYLKKPPPDLPKFLGERKQRAYNLLVPAMDRYRRRMNLTYRGSVKLQKEALALFMRLREYAFST